MIDYLKKHELKVSTKYFTRAEVMKSITRIRRGIRKYREQRETFYYTDGSFYDGEWRGGWRDGMGTMTWMDGSVYSGEWELGRARGKGEFTLPNGLVFNGQWRSHAFFGSIDHSSLYENGY